MTWNSVMALTLRYFTEFGKAAFHHITINIDQKSASITREAVTFARVTFFQFIVSLFVLVLDFRLL